MIRRGIGLVLVSAFVLAFEPGDASGVNRVLLPALAALGAWLTIDRLAPVALAVAVLAGIHSDLSATDPLLSVVYPLATLAGASTSAIIFARAFLRHMRETRDARLANRDARGGTGHA